MKIISIYLLKINSLIFYFILGYAFSVVAQNKSLTYYLTSASTNSPLLNDYNNKILSNKIDSMQQQASYGYIVSGEGAASYAPTFKGWGYDKALTNGQSLFAGARVSKNLIGRNQLATRLASFDAVKKQLLTQQSLARQTLNKAVTEQYIATYSSEQLYKNANEINTLLQQEDLVLKKLTQAGVFKQTDYLTFKVTLQQIELARMQLKADWQNNFMLLNYTCGVVDTALVFLEIPETQVTNLSFESSVYREAFVADSLQLANKAALILYDYKPKISAFSDAGYQSSFISAPYKNLGFSLGIAVSIPLYDGHKKEMLLQQNKLELATRENYLLQTKKQYEQTRLQLAQQIITYENMEKLAREQMVFSRTLIEANAKQLPTGDVRVVDFILAINNYLNLKVTSIQYQATLYSLHNQLQNLTVQ